MRDPSRVHVCGVLEPFKTGFAIELARQGYTPGSCRNQLQLMAHVSRWLTEQGLQVSDLPCHAARFLRTRRAAGYDHYVSDNGLRPMSTYLCSLGLVAPALVPVPTGPVEVMLARYRHYLTTERALGHATARGYSDAVRPFLRTRVTPDGLSLDLDHVSPHDVTAFVVRHTPTQSRRAAKMTVTTLRSLLRFLHVEGLTSASLVAAVPSAAGWRLAGIPKSIDATAVGRLLAACDTQTSAGRRDFAILTTLARLGLRAAEVANLQLEDILWRCGEIVVRGKGSRVERLPMPADVGTAVAAYLRDSRPITAQGRTVFVRLMAPHEALSPIGLTQVVAAAARRAGLGTIHAHRLRHFVATQTLRRGGTLSEIKQLLRHARASTTAIYAKVDREALRNIARPWPGGVA
jgi:site-specific recombinase XerD